MHVSKDKPIFSVDIHPDGSRVATGGQGEDCGKVVIWNMGPIRDEKEEADLSTPRILCQMDNHLGCVNCVRWSGNGKFLASGGDDKLVMIWQTSRGLGSGKSFGCSVTIVEQWRALATLRGHSGDVLDLAWSPQDVWLASCSVDNSIVIWNALKFPDQVAILKGHSGLVKGVTWDPVGKYLASQSDDKSLKVWRTSDWKEESSITSCFEECGGTTHVLRLNWSPDGNHIVSAHAMNNRGPTAQIVERNGWGTSLDFVGHRKAITVVKFNPKILSKQIKRTSEKQQQYSCCAIGSKDRSLSIWLTALKRPLVVLHDLFEKSILDISWSSSGLELMCCSLDGTVAYLGFDQSEIGMPMFKDDQQALLEKIYGKSVLASKATNASSHIIESAAVLNLQQEQQQHRERENSMSGSSVPPKALSAVVATGDQPFKPRDKQIETRTPDGKRRITPIFLAPQPDIGDAGIPAPFTNKSIAFNSSKETSKIITERQDRVTQPGLNVSSNSSQSHSLASPPHHLVNTIMHQPTAVSETKTCITEPGATTPFIPLHTPMDVDKTPVRPVTSTPVSRQESQNDKERVKEKEKERDKDPDLDKTKDKDREKLKGNLSLKRRHGKVGRPRKSERETQMAAMVSHPLPVLAEPERTRPVLTSQDLQLSVPTIQKSSVHLIEGQMGSDNCTTVEVENKLSIGTRQMHRVRCVSSGKVLWEQLLTSPVIAVAGSRQVTCVACEDKTLTIFGVGGRRLWPPLVLGSQVSVLKCTGCYIMAVISQGYLYVWNSRSVCGVIQGQTLSAIMTVSERVIRAALTNEGVPLLTISSGRSFIFAPEIGSWMLVNDRDDYLHVCSDHHRCSPSKGRASGPLASVQGGGSSNQQAGRIFQSDASMQQMSTVSHLENQLASSLALKSASEYCFWLETYIRYLAQEGLEGKLRAVCDDLLGPVYARTSGSNGWQPTILVSILS
ncbi:hypothetical protein C0Q70_07143 [Pomacea canaliculata]|uniref:Protein HIRA n=1 Tax=Pomacea canaliculata TaxID=400727 RepID=A0A2T7PE80_POMCA|nr:hypothetical protein C0Q70_07143 [Pomacea canaliculata]